MYNDGGVCKVCEYGNISVDLRCDTCQSRKLYYDPAKEQCSDSCPKYIDPTVGVCISECSKYLDVSTGLCLDECPEYTDLTSK